MYLQALSFSGVDARSRFTGVSSGLGSSGLRLSTAATAEDLAEVEDEGRDKSSLSERPKSCIETPER